jgi:hypothetical protein
MRLYLNANNKATRTALIDCGVKNVMVAHKYAYASIDTYRDNFDKVFVVAGVKANEVKYNDWLIKNKDKYDYATQFDVFYDMKATMECLKTERDMGIDWTLPVLQENYQQHLMLLKPKPNDYVCIGEVKGRIETEEQIRRLPGNLKYHGLAKGKYIAKNRMFESLDTSAWISAAVSKKTEVWRNNSGTSMFFGEKGKHMKAQLSLILEQNKDNLESCNIKKQDVLDNEYDALLRLPLAIYFRPLCKGLGILDANFK